MWKMLPTLAALLASAALLMVGNGLFSTLLAVRLNLEGSDETQIGMVMSAYFAGLVVGSVVCGRIIARVGHIRSFAVFAAVMAAAALAHALRVDAPTWIALRATTGFAMAGVLMAIESWLNASATRANRGQVLAVYMATFYLALGLGQLLLNAADPASFRLFSVVGIFFALSLVPIALTRAPTPELPARSTLRLSRLLEAAPVGVIGSFVAGLVLGAFYGLAPVFAQGIGLSLGGTSALMTVAILGGLVLQYPIGHVSDFVDRRLVLLIVGGGAAAASAGLVVAGSSTAVLFPLIAIFGGFAFTLYPLAVAHANDRLDAEELVGAAGLLLLCYGVGAVIGPALGAAGMRGLGPAGLFAVLSAACACLALYVQWRRFRVPAYPGETHTAYVSVPRSTPVASELDPRSDPKLSDPLAES
jgi:MFS family permease